MAHIRILAAIAVLFLLTFCSEENGKPDPVPSGNEFILEDPPQYGTPFQDIPVTEDVVMYEVNLRAFSPANLNGVIAKLDHIRSLGVNVIWLMPVFPIGQVNSVNSPYCVKNYRGVNPEFGTLDDLRNLTTEAHQRGMAVILDWVANHTSWDNPWLKYQSWYTRENGQVIHPAGTNWEDVADLNFDSPDMRKAMISALKYWILDANIDGYRCDAADMVPFDFWKQAIDSLNSIQGRNVIMLAEGARSDHFTAGFSMNYAWDFYGKLKSVFSGQAASGLYTTHTSEYSAIPGGKHKLRFTTNHDESAWDATPVTLFGGVKGALAASVIAVYMGGVPLFYGSQEVGRAATLPFFTNNPVNWNENPDMLAAYRWMMEFYTGSDAARKGTLVSYPYEDVCVFTKTSDQEEILVMVNVRNSVVNITFPPVSGTFYRDAASGATFLEKGNTVALQPYQYIVANRVYRNN
ncbi:MAG: alpha-glucosidase C-terminal domain-containing protein [Bacteroidales bacterium]|nr:alpha-glucosidase C-terminal domain-containing protein [Bacteroidales bacterium]